MATHNMDIHAHGYVYRLVDSTNNETFYIGSTCTTLPKRLYKHRASARNNGDKQRKYHFPVYVRMREAGLDNVRIVLIQEYANITKRDLTKREQEHIDTNNGIANVTAAYVSTEQQKANARQRSTKWNATNSNKYTCDICHYATSRKNDHRQHCASKRHCVKVAEKAVAVANEATIAANEAMMIARDMTDDEREHNEVHGSTSAEHST